MIRNLSLVYFGFALVLWATAGLANDIVHDAEFYVLAKQNGEAWAREDKALNMVRGYKTPSINQFARDTSLYFWPILPYNADQAGINIRH